MSRTTKTAGLTNRPSSADRKRTTKSILPKTASARTAADSAAERGRRGHFSEGNRGAAPNPRETSAVLSVLDKMKPAAQSLRFLQAWTPEQQLTFGCGDGDRGVLIRDDGDTMIADTGLNSRLSPAVARQWAQRTTAQDEASIDGRPTFEAIRSLLNEFVHFDDPRVSTLVTLWIMGTYQYSMFSHFGYLFFHSTLPRSGKTRILEMISHLAFEATSPQNAPTTATIRELASEGRTLQLDTLERWRGKSAEAFCMAMEMLDAGFRNGGTVSKMVPSDDGSWRRQSFPVYAPYTMAAIDKDSLADTALDRSFAIEMRRKAIRIHTRKYNFHAVERECGPIREALYFWALANAARVAAIYQSAEHDAAVDRIQLHDRASDIWKPLLAIARALDLDLAPLAAMAAEMSGDPDAQADRQKLTILDRLLALRENGKVIGTTTELQPLFDGLNVHTTLTAWGFAQEKRRIDGESRRAWVLPARGLEALARELRGEGGYYPQNSDHSDHVLGDVAEGADDGWLERSCDGRWLPAPAV
jgi:hypothetical protein